jgi:hypothetical protein
MIPLPSPYPTLKKLNLQCLHPSTSVRFPYHSPRNKNLVPIQPYWRERLGLHLFHTHSNNSLPNCLSLLMQ